MKLYSLENQAIAHMEKEIINSQIKEALGRATSMLSSREYREEQLQMCQFIRRYLGFAKEPGHVAMIEAGTGVGKTYGYLIPALEYLKFMKEKNENTARFIVATSTISLQEQLTGKDLPNLTSLYPKIKFAKAKGRNNYVCQYKLNNPEVNLFASDLETGFENQIREWLDSPEGSSGDRSDINFELQYKDWNLIKANQLDCYGTTCPYHKECYYNRAKAKVQSADIIVTTHAMVLADYKQNGGLPDYTHLIIDEAHNFGKNATSALTVGISQSRVNWLISQSKSKYCNSGLRQGRVLGKVDDWQKSLKTFADIFFHSLPEGRVLIPADNQDGKNLVNCIRYVLPLLIKSTESTDLKIVKAALENLYAETSALALELETWLDQSNPDSVYWVEKGEAQYVPINIGKMITPLWSSKNSILTSATLCVAKEFKTIRNSFNLYDNTYTIRLESPFNYRENGIIYVPPKAPSPKSRDYINYVTDTVIKALGKTQGKTFVLFTSYSMMKEVAERLQSVLGKEYTWLIQGADTRERLLKNYRLNRNAVLLGTDTFWEGIDEDIDCVILTKLPFAVPTSPIEEARYELVKSRGGNPFMILALPQCAIKLKQGAGRLIRHQTKRGVIVICDPRIDQNWGQAIKKTLPDMKWTTDISMMDGYLEQRVG